MFENQQSITTADAINLLNKKQGVRLTSTKTQHTVKLHSGYVHVTDEEGTTNIMSMNGFKSCYAKQLWTTKPPLSETDDATDDAEN